MALSRIVSEIINVEKYRDLEIPVKGPSRSLKVVPFDKLGMFSYSCSIATLSLPLESEYRRVMDRQTHRRADRLQK